jgi:ABC-type uncharacterized transport system ATPase subunit
LKFRVVNGLIICWNDLKKVSQYLYPKAAKCIERKRRQIDYAIDTTDLTKRFDSLTAVSKLNLKVQKNTIHGFLGPNGAGKTTTIKMLVGLLKPTSGSVKVLGERSMWTTLIQD